MSYDEKFMKRAIELAKEAFRNDEVPIGAVIVKDGEIVGEGMNYKERKNNATRHAEMVAIDAATSEIGNWWLEDCEMYVTLEPCPMCAGAMINSRIKELYFGAYDEKCGAYVSKVNLFEEGLFNHDINVSGGYLKEECASLLSEFFSRKRKEKRA